MSIPPPPPTGAPLVQGAPTTLPPNIPRPEFKSIGLDTQKEFQRILGLYERRFYRGFNVLPVKELSDVHLYAEYSQIMKMPIITEKYLKPTKRIYQVKPKSFVSKGYKHILYFLDKGRYLYNRYIECIWEIQKRGFQIEDKYRFNKKFYRDNLLWSNYFPTKFNLTLMRYKIAEEVQRCPQLFNISPYINPEIAPLGPISNKFLTHDVIVKEGQQILQRSHSTRLGEKAVEAGAEAVSLTTQVVKEAVANNTVVKAAGNVLKKAPAAGAIVPVLALGLLWDHYFNKDEQKSITCSMGYTNLFAMSLSNLTGLFSSISSLIFSENKQENQIIGAQTNIKPLTRTKKLMLSFKNKCGWKTKKIIQCNNRLQKKSSFIARLKNNKIIKRFRKQQI